MRVLARSLLALLLVGLATGKVSSQTATTHAVTAAEYERWKTDLSNWGRWGKDDEIGALNLITPEKRKQAAGLVKEGFSVSLAGDADTVQAVDNPNPYDVKMLAIGNDRIGVAYHGIAHTHLDSLAHINDNGVFFNGYKPDADSVLKNGHAKNSIHNVKNGIFTRGILIDIPRLKGVPYLEPGTPSMSRTWRRGKNRRGSRYRPATRCSCARAYGHAARPLGHGFAAAPRGAGRQGSILRSSPG